MKRVLIIAVILEALKYIFLVCLINLPEGFLTNVFGIIVYIWFLPELGIGGEHPPHHWYTVLARLGIGVSYNLLIALFISGCLPDKEVESMKNQIPS